MNKPLSYDKFRTGYTYAEVYNMIWNRQWKRRRGVLGFWRELKLQMYAQYLHEFEQSDGLEYIPSDEPIPD